MEPPLSPYPKRGLGLGVIVVALLLTVVAFWGPLGAPSRAPGGGAGEAPLERIPQSCRTLMESPPPAAPPPDDLVLSGGTVVTMDEGTPRARSVVLRDGLIDEVDQGLAAAPSTPVVDLDGATVLPGFIDSHSHWIGDRLLQNQTRRQAVDAALAQGWTSISELFVPEERLDELCLMESDGDLRVKVGAFLPANYEHRRFGHWYEDYEAGSSLGPHLFLQGIKFFADRAPDGLGYQTDPPDPAVQGVLFWEPEELATELRRAHAGGWQIAVHATGDGGLDVVLEAFEELGGEEITRARHRIEHVTMVRDEQVQQIADLGLIASVQHPWFHSGTTDTLLRWIGRDRIGLAGRWRDLLDARIPLTGSTDRPWSVEGTSGPSLPALGNAVTRIGPEGRRPPVWMESQRLTVDEALRSITIDAAFAQGSEGSVGSIEVGKAADLVVLSADPTRVPPELIGDITVLATLVDGRVEFCAPNVPRDLTPLCPKE